MQILEIILFSVLVLIFMIISIFYLISLINNIIYKVPQVSTFKSDFKVLKDNLWKYNLEWKKIADLGSWIWKVIRFLEKEFWAKVTGYEIDYSNVIIAKIINKIFSSKTNVIRWNYFKVDLKQYDYIYVYLYPVLMEKLEEKIWSDAKKWTIVFVNAFKFQNHEPIDVFYKGWREKIFVYKI